VRLVVRGAAETDIAEAARWYELRSSGLGSEFLRAVDVALAEIIRMPERYPVVRGTARRALLRRFPYAIYFVATPDLVSVFACLHARRHPRHCTTPQFWLGLQADYDLDVAADELGERLEREVQVRAKASRGGS
jgi:plasmid stabilization system protein ParE